MFSRCAVFLFALCFGAFAGCSRQDVALPISSEVDIPLSNTDWAFHGLNRAESRFVDLDQVNVSNVNTLSLAWYVDLPENRGQEATPIVIDGVMYSTSAWNHILAIDATSGNILWQYDPDVPKDVLVKACCGPVNRGVAYAEGVIFSATLDGRLLAIDAKDGELLWIVSTVNTEEPYTITGAPRVFNDKVFIGNGGAEYGVRGYLSAYDAKSGDLVWRFYTVPGEEDDPTGVEPVASQRATWRGEFWRLGGGGTVWDSMALDSETNTLYFGVGNGSPWNPMMRTQGEGDNWFLSSIVAVDADTGEYRWHYQTTPMEAWDFTATQHMILGEVTFDGVERDVLMQAPKNGFFYVLDRHTGELLSAEPIVPVNWASHVDLTTGRPVVNDDAKYWLSDKPTLITPSWMGAHNWHPMSWHPELKTVFIPTQETAFPYLAEHDQAPTTLAVNLGVDTKAAALPDNQEVISQVQEATKGFLLAWDVEQAKPLWKVEYPGAWNGGTLTTAGNLVFQGSAAGFLYAYHAETGERLWEYPAQTGIVAPPISYSVDGKQYITVSAGWGGIFPLMTGVLAEDSAGKDAVNRSRLLTFVLDGVGTLPEETSVMTPLPDAESITINDAIVPKGAALYDRFCVNCHGAGAVGGGVVPDLRYSPTILSEDAWLAVVGHGTLKNLGMVAFGDELSSQEIEHIRHYIIERNRQQRAEGKVSKRGF
jgi:alcohol dehydrogenase (cytochrome c)/quinohemoprotein ethanol dehydrogenase